MIQVIIPTLGETISSGILASWHVSDGDYVDEGQMLYELETDKITSEGHAEAAGIISLKVEAGAEVEIGATVAEIDETAAKPAVNAPATEKKVEAPPPHRPEPANEISPPAAKPTPASEATAIP